VELRRSDIQNVLFPLTSRIVFIHTVYALPRKVTARENGVLIHLTDVIL